MQAANFQIYTAALQGRMHRAHRHEESIATSSQTDRSVSRRNNDPTDPRR